MAEVYNLKTGKKVDPNTVPEGVAGKDSKEGLQSHRAPGPQNPSTVSKMAPVKVNTGPNSAGGAAPGPKAPPPKSKAEVAADKAKADERAAKEKWEKSDEKSVTDIAAALKVASQNTAAAGADTSRAIDGANRKGDDATEAFQKVLSEKSKMLDEKAKQIESLSKWHQGIVTSYEDLSTRYRDAVTGLSGDERKGMQTKAKGDYMAMSGLGAQAAGIQAGAMGGPATGMQQQLMGATFQQQATSAYSAAQKNISSVDEQRRVMQFQIAQSASADERSNRQLGYNMEGQQIAAGISVINQQTSMAGSSYGASMAGFAQDRNDAIDKYGIGLNTIGAQTNANTYAPTAHMALNNKELMAGFSNRGLGIQEQQLKQSGNVNPWAAAGSGAMAGGMVGGPWGAAAGAVIGFGGATMTNK